ncbi:uncharacterized protein LOC110683534 [Chenopodium quinoa]|uniref:uncharacterized protein LOC110683534 n=1 Tax=Chenopodium quinoa TaxID=63459 RepID=UPI000B781F8B|nr:uncharacterized protein LOC110683534 [Chenopodium quinoa]
MEVNNKTDKKYVQRGLSKYQLFGDDGMPNYAMNTTPLFEVFSVSVNTKRSDCDSCEIYGTIKATNGLGHVVYLYNRKHYDPELIKPNSAGYSRYLSLIGLKDGCVIIPHEYVTIEVDLRDRARNNAAIAIGNLSFNYKETFYSGHGAKDVVGQAGFVTIHYATFPYALTASVDVVFFSKNDDYDTIDYDPDEYSVDLADYDSSGYENSDDVADIYGTVAAHTDFPGSGSYGDNTTISSILLNKPHSQCVRVMSRNFIELSRCMVAVPASSNFPLKIHVDFKFNDGSRLVDGVLGFSSDDCSQIKKDIVGENGRIRVRVKWGDAYEQRYRGTDLKRNLNQVLTPGNEESKLEELVKRQWFPDDPQPSSVFRLPQTPMYISPTPLVEVFSVGVGSNDLKPPFKL